jgi:DNA-binding transcriptional LysR family regulator
MFQLFQLRCFIAVANELHFGKAAVRLNMTQPPLTRQIQLLEEELGVRLLERNRRSVRLTAAGRVFLAEADFLLRRSAAAKEAAQLAESGSSGTLVLGFIPAASYDRLPRIVTEVRRHFPDLELVLRELSTADQLEALEFRRIDLGIVRPTRSPTHISVQRISREPLMLALPADHPLASADALQVKDLDGEPFVMYSPVEGRYFHDMLLAMFQTAGVAPRFVQHVSQDHTVLSLVSAGLGVSLVPRSAVQLGFPSIKFREIELPPSVGAELFAAYRSDNEEPVMRRVLELLGRMHFS